MAPPGPAVGFSTATLIQGTDARQTWTDSCNSYCEYLIILIIWFFLLIIWLQDKIKQISTCSGNVISTLGNHFCDSNKVLTLPVTPCIMSVQCTGGVQYTGGLS